MPTWLLVVTADMRRWATTVEVGPETARVCRAAAKAAREDPDANLCVPAGWSPRYEVCIGDVVRAYLIEHCQIESHRIHTPPPGGEPCTTYGEMQVFAQYLFRRDPRPRVTMFVRHWHARRAHALMRAEFRRMNIRPVRTLVTRVPSRDIFWRFFETAKLLKELALRRIRIEDCFAQPDSS